MSGGSIMVQGTMSGVGKSLIAAGLCRVLAQDGLRVAPFKAQNMALNSHVTFDGCEIGRAQAVQAQAAGIEPEAIMNPVLLKPTGPMGSQVIVRGRPIGTMSARDYFAYRPRLTPVVMACFAELRRRFDAVVIEGAGSPVEINLGPDEFVNMGMARRAGAPVLLVGDIDRGGVFAQMVGTLTLMSPEDRALVRGLVVNKFRGDATILEPGLRQLEQLAGVPVTGVVPYARLDIEEEDSLGEPPRPVAADEGDGVVDVAVVRLPHLSNAGDFDPLAAAPGVRVRFVEDARRLGAPDLVVLPGTKATLADLRWLRERALDAAIASHVRAGGLVLGVCGGFQMLGAHLGDPDGVEEGGAACGLGLLPVRTTFSRAKRTVRTHGQVLAVPGPFAAMAGAVVEGYEVHHGVTERMGGLPFARVEAQLRDGAEEGCVCGTVAGTYQHGLFDTASAVRGLVEAVCAHAGKPVPTGEVVGRATQRERAYDTLADILRASLDMRQVHRLLKEGV
ncbi:cobyric acid synthase [Eggerthellaceae bacterium zg-997]|nr:cobyric acid synthase [Eggerthellaceae bacterium zg-997]